MLENKGMPSFVEIVIVIVKSNLEIIAVALIKHC